MTEQESGGGIPADPQSLRQRALAAIEGVKESVKEFWDNLHIGEGHAKAMFKLGAHEVTQVLPAFPESNVRPLEEPGVVFNETMPHIVEPHHGLDDVMGRTARNAPAQDNEMER